MITADLVAIGRVGERTHGAPITRESGEAWISRYNKGDGWTLVRVASCPCCGEPAWDNGRCTKHQGRNPCVVEGCGRTAAAPEDGTLSNDMAICGTHWRAYVPPRSRDRRLYQAHWRRARKLGWNYHRIRQFEAFWDRLVARVRARADGGHIDEAAINRLMGWD